jgi:hypothetical protein
MPTYNTDLLRVAFVLLFGMTAGMIAQGLLTLAGR